MVPVLVQYTVLSAKKFAYADYISIYNGYQVNIYYGLTTKTKILEVGVLKGWRCPVARICCIPLKANIKTTILKHLD